MQLLGIGLALIGVIYVWLAAIIPMDPWVAEEAINTRTLPVIYGITFLLACQVLLIKGRGSAEPISAAGRRRIAGLLASLVGFALAVPWLGVWLATPVLLVPALYVMGERRWWALSVLPASTGVFGWLLVNQLLGVFVPAGEWFS